MSTSRVTAPGASLVCSVASTAWPVSAACTAVRAVASSRISPIMMTSGSCRRMLRSARGKERPTASPTWIWLMKSSWYSTGSSTVITFFSGLRRRSSAEYSVVVLPLPVGPVTSVRPCGRLSTSSSVSSCIAVSPSSSIRVRRFRLSRMRMTSFSPSSVGIDDTRRSMSRPSAFSRTRPSWGSRFSAMSILPITFTRETIAECMPAGGLISSRSTPSIR